jgi:alpha-tubulin suppressor-like RCC1 family protein
VTHKKLPRNTKNPRTIQTCWFLCAALLLQALTSDAQPVVKIAAGNTCSIFVRSDGSMWITGRYKPDEITQGPGTNHPQLIASNNVIAVAANQGYSMFIKSDGSLWGIGYIIHGQFGNGTYNSTDVPEQIVASNVTAIAAGVFHSLFLKSDGSLWGMGVNSNGELGNGNYPQGINRPQLIVSSNVTAIAAGINHSLFLKRDGSLWGMGSGAAGQLGEGFSDSRRFTSQPVQVMASNVVAIAAGRESSLFIKNDGSLWAIGGNLYGQLGMGTNWTARPIQIATNVVAVANGLEYTLFLKRDGSLWGMGRNWAGQLGDGTTNDVHSPEMIVPADVTAIAAGRIHSLFLKRDGSLWAMGYNGYGLFGDGTFSDGTNRPVQVLTAPRPNIINGELLNGSLSFSGYANAKYVLDRSFTQIHPLWIPQATNSANSSGELVFPNLPYPATNIFWRVRFVE